MVRLRARDEYLGRIKAADEEATIKAAIKAFAITNPEQQKRLLVRCFVTALSLSGRFAAAGATAGRG